MEPPSANSDLKPWERGYYDTEAEQETESAHAAFRAYLTLSQGDRSVDKAYRGTKKGPKGSQKGPGGTTKGPRAPGRWKTWAKQWRWVERAKAYDAEMASVQAEAMRQALRKSAIEGADRIARELIEDL